MSAPLGSPGLTLNHIVKPLRTTFETFADPRRGQNTRYTMVDAALSAFSVFFMQSPSFLEHQRTLQEAQGQNNAQTLLGVDPIPTDNPIRSLLDGVEPTAVYPLFHSLFQGLEQEGIIERYRALGNTLLLARDGTRYFSSQTIRCACCSTPSHANGQVTYFHSVVLPVWVKPGLDKVIPSAPECVPPQDGAAKQDCELNAAKRWFAPWASHDAALGMTVLGDDLYGHEPFCRAVLHHGFHFLLACKPESHPALYEWLAFWERGGAVHTFVRRRWTGTRREFDTDRDATAVPLRDADDALHVNGCELTTTTAEGKVVYRNALATSHPLPEHNVPETVAAGRSRWKIENENNNTLKTKGYHFEHHDGHGQQHRSSLLATLIVLAYLTHTVLEWVDDPYRWLRQKRPSRKRLFHAIRALTCYLCFDGWEHWLDLMLQGFHRPIRAPDTG